MISLGKLSRKNLTDILSSKLFCDRTFYRAFIKDLKHSKSEVIIESPFIAIKRTNHLLPVLAKLSKKGLKVRVNTRNPKHHEQDLWIQAWTSIKQLRKVGVKVKFYDDMRHRKLAVLDRQILWEGSLNILSQSHSKEIMRRTNSKALTIQMIRFTAINTWR